VPRCRRQGTSEAAGGVCKIPPGALINQIVVDYLAISKDGGSVPTFSQSQVRDYLEVIALGTHNINIRANKHGNVTYLVKYQ
jgi:hypothetical protein